MPDPLCKWCGDEFRPHRDKQNFCCPSHRVLWNGWARTYGRRHLEFNGMDQPGKLQEWAEREKVDG